MNKQANKQTNKQMNECKIQSNTICFINQSINQSLDQLINQNTTRNTPYAFIVWRYTTTDTINYKSLLKFLLMYHSTVPSIYQTT